MSDLQVTDLWCLLGATFARLKPLYEATVDPLGLTLTEWYVLRRLYEQDRQHPTDLARAVGRLATSFTPILNELQLKGWIEREADTEDRRAVWVSLTPKAEALRDQIQQGAAEIDTLIANTIQEKVSLKDWKTLQWVLLVLQG